MACPYFEPRSVAASPLHANARLPLVEEYEGLCLAAAEPFTAPADTQFRLCNQGYPRGGCERFPSDETRSCLRYELLSRNENTLEVMIIAERDYAPVDWRVVRYSTATGAEEPEISDACMRAQLAAFCRAYLNRYLTKHATEDSVR